MIKVKLFLSFLFISLAIPGFTQITADVKEGCVPLKVTFKAPAAGSYFWDFKDGVTSDKQEPVNVFTRAGTYNVTFQETPGGPVLGTIQIKVYPDPELKIKVASGCAPLNAQFESISVIDPAVTVNNYIWVYGDGRTSQGPVSTSTHLYNNLGKYDVSFTIETKFPTCNKTVIFSEAVEVLSQPVASFTTTPASTISCRDTLDVSFVEHATGVKPLTYSWNFGNGKTSADQNPTGQQRYFKGSYTASLTVKYPDTFVGCASIASQTISVGRPVPVIKLKKDTTCINTATVIKTTTPGTYNWNFGPNATPATATLDSVDVTFTKAGWQQISLTVTSPDGQCSDSRTARIYVDEVTARIQSPDPTFSCESPRTVHYNGVSNQTNVKYLWVFTDTSKTFTTKNVTRKYISGSDTIYYDRNVLEEYGASLQVVSNKTGCMATATRQDTMWLPNARFMPDITKGCVPLTINFSDSSTSFDKITSWNWIYEDGTVDSKTNNNKVTHTYTKPGEYLVKLEVKTQKQCRDTSYAVLIEVGKDLTSEIDFTASKSEVCPGEPVTFTANPTSSAAALIDAYHFKTEENRVFHCSDQNNVTWSYNDKAGPQNVTLTADYNGCFTTLTKAAFVNVKGAIAHIDYSALCSAPMEYTFKDKSQNATKITWNFGDGQTGNNATEKHNYASTGTYFVKLTAENGSGGCAPDQDFATVHVQKVEAKIKIDTLLCINSNYVFSAADSRQVDATCHKGYTWQFPTMDKRPYTSDNSTASFAFDVNGVHTVRMIARDINGCTDTAVGHFKVFKIDVKPVADKTLICNPTTVKFTDNSTSDTTIVSWDWNFRDNSTTAVQNPSHTFTTAPDVGSYYDVGLTLKDALGCISTQLVSIRHYKPTSNITLSPKPQLCLGDPVTLKADFSSPASSAFTFTWDLDNGTTSSVNNKQVVYAAARDYHVSLAFTETSSGCSGTVDTLIQVQDYPKAGITTNVDTLKVLCAPQNVFFKDASTTAFPPLSYYWDFGDGQQTYDQDYSMFYEKGTWTATHIVQTTFGCSDTVKQTFKVFKPLGKFEMTRDTICKGEEIGFSIIDTADVASYTWAFGDGTTLDNDAPVTHTYNFHHPSGQTYARLILRGFDGICPVTLQKPVYIWEVIADFDRENGGDTSICFNDGPYHFTNTSTDYDSFVWNLGDGSTSTQLNPVHSYALPGTYDVTLSVASSVVGCKDTISRQAVIYPNPKVITVGDTACLGDKLHPKVINPVATSSYLWTPATGLSSETAPQPEATLDHTTFYRVVETDTNGCTGFSDVPALVIEPIGLADWDTSIVIGDQVSLPVYGQAVYHYKWTPEDGLSCLQCNYPLVRPLKDITYLLEVTDIRGCFPPETYKFFIEVKPETFVKLPSTFTPNGDGSNDVVYVRGWGIKDLLEFSIFNRWGQLIYTSTNINEGWDGTFKGVIQNSDVYVYKVKVRTWRDEEIYDEGYINLLH